MFMLKATQEVDLALESVTDTKGNPTTVQNPTWSTDDDTVATLTTTDGTSTTVRAGDLGTATITMEADADLGDGVTPIVGTFEVDVVAGDAAIVNIAAGTPREQTTDAPTDTPDAGTAPAPS